MFRSGAYSLSLPECFEPLLPTIFAVCQKDHLIKEKSFDSFDRSSTILRIKEEQGLQPKVIVVPGSFVPFLSGHVFFP